MVKANFGNEEVGKIIFDNLLDGEDEAARRMQCSSSDKVILSKLMIYETLLKNDGHW